MSGIAGDVADDPQQVIAALRHELDARTAERDQALAREAATAEVLQVINSSPGDLAPVFDAMLEKATKLCDASLGTLWEYDGERMHPLAMRGVSPEYAEYLSHQPLRPGAGALGSFVRGETILHVADLKDTAAYRSGDTHRRALVDLGGGRALLGIPLRTDDRLRGAFLIYRREPQPFTDKQIALLQNFAHQAVIAMENARLLTETREALEQQTATAEVLQVINSSPGNLAPVFDAMLEKATRLGEAVFGIMLVPEGEALRAVASRGLPPALDNFLQQPVGAPPGSMSGRLRRGDAFVHIDDIASDDGYQDPANPVRRALVDLGGARTGLAVALRKEAEFLGALWFYRREVRPFSEKQIALLQNFAAQAVIAMENARLLTETREALAQQTATAEVLRVINTSPGDLAPVFDAMLERATRFCDAGFGILSLYEGNDTHRIVAGRNVPKAFTETTQGPLRQGPETAAGRLVRGEAFVHISDAENDDAHRSGNAARRAIVDVAGARAFLAVPLKTETVYLGSFTIFRQTARPFTDKQIALLQNFAAQAVIAMENARLITETREALEQQTATAEVLQVINSSPGDPAPVFDAILEKAHTLCGAAHGSLTLAAGEYFRAVATRGMPEEFARVLRQPFHPGVLGERLSGGEPFVQIADIASTPTDSSVHRAAVGPGGVRTLLAVPLRKDRALLGYITANRQEVRPFSDKQIALLQNFAAQAVIAMENARLITETREALEQQTATAEVLQVINSSPGDVAPVFDAMLEKALNLCDAVFGGLWTYENDAFYAVATRNFPDALTDYTRAPLPAAGALGALVQGQQLIHTADITEDEIYRSGEPGRQALADLGGARTVLWMSLRKDDALLGTIVIYRKDVRPFTDKQIALLQNFAAQAVIAMENARLLTETREALAQQTATAEVLQVINSSPGDLTPVFDAMLEKAMRLCGFDHGSLQTYDGDLFHAVAVRGLPEPLAVRLRQGFRPELWPRMLPLLDGEQFVQISDLTQEDQSHEGIKRAVEFGSRTLLFVPLRADTTLLGQIVAVRQEVRPFTEKQIALLQNFAAQAVIAMENARLLTETREALAQQTATAEVLQVINSSPGDLAPVFDAMLEKAVSLCGAARGQLATYDGERFRFVAVHGDDDFVAEQYGQGAQPPSVGVTWSRIVAGEPVVHIVDVKDTALYRAGHDGARRFVDHADGRSLATVALRKDGILLGALTVYRQEVLPFSGKQIALLQNFAAQAVIAMENARLLTETREALDRQTATAEVLQVINSSPGDLAPVFDAMLEKAMHLCDAAFGQLWTYDGDAYYLAASCDLPAAFEAFSRGPQRPGPQTAHGRVLAGEHVVHIADIAAEEAYRAGDPHRRRMVDLVGARSLLAVALRQDERLLGILAVYRQEVRPFADTQIALLQNFAAQAVVAMENARLISETREALAQQTATAEVLQVINSSPGDLAPVFEAMLEKAHSLCGADHGSLYLYDGEQFRAVASHGLTAMFASTMQQGTASDWPIGQSLIAGAPFVHIHDTALAEHPNYRNLDVISSHRTLLAVPLRKGHMVLGLIIAGRFEVRPFADTQIALLQNFAAQAVIAMENARLITETREALERQTATAEVLQVINSSPGDLAPVFDAMLEKAMRLGEASFGMMHTFDGKGFNAAAMRGVPEAYTEYRKRNPLVIGPGSGPARIMGGESIVHIVDLAADPAYRAGEAADRAVVELAGARSILSVPLRKEDELLGMLTVFRQQVRPFTDKQIALLQNFAAQAVIAMENARLITETREALEQQTATAEVLQVINSSPGDLAPVFDAILEKAHSLCGATHGVLVTYDGEHARAVATHRVSEPLAGLLRQPFRPMPNSPHANLLREHCIIHIPDLLTEPLWERDDPRRIATTEQGVRTMLFVPLRKDDLVLGWIAANRLEMRPFSEKQIALLQNFAAQAVIAMENARLLTETRQALERQTATAEVLQVINSSPGDLVPVFDAMLERATRLCNAPCAMLWTYDGEAFSVPATFGVPEAFAEYLRQPLEIQPSVFLAALRHGETFVHNLDLADTDSYRHGNPLNRAVVDLGGARTGLLVPLQKDGRLLGAFRIYRHEVRRFTDKQIALLQNFAAQAVIAMENARLLTETREALAQQTATAEVLQVINSSPGELQPVFEAILEKGHQLCGVPHGSLQLYDGEKFAAVAVHGLSGPLADRLREGYRPGPTYPVWRVLQGERFVHTPDLAEIDDPLARSVVALGGARTLLWVALRREDKLFGLIAAARLEVRPFSDKEIALLEGFAAQAVIAIDNARLLNEIRRHQAELRVTFDNMGDGVAMFDAELRLAAWNTNFRQVLDLPEAFLEARPHYQNYVRYLAERGEYGAVDVEDEVRRLTQLVGGQGSRERTRPDGRVVEVRYNAVPDGGFVLIYSDVTERKRAEAEIRAARDAAERALAELKTTQASLVHAEKMASLGQLTAGIAHEIKNPLNFVNNFAGLSVELLDELKEASAPAVASLDSEMRAEIDEIVETLSGNLAKIGEHGKRADGIVTSMLAHSRGTSGERQKVDLNALVEEALNLAYHGARAQDQEFNIAMERAFEPGLAPIEIVPQDLTRVFLNLFGNGFYAAHKRAREEKDGFRPLLVVATHELGDMVEIRVRDNGAGIPAEIRDKLFQPFFTTKPTGEGTGLGLSISWDIVTQQHGGTIVVASEPGQFTEFTVRLPRTRQPLVSGER